VRAGLAAEFGSAEGLRRARDALAALGYRRLEWYAPFPLEEAGPAARPSRLPARVFLGGLAGGVLGYAVQWYANVGAYLQNVGGRPAHAVPAFVPATFEATVLGAALVAFFGVLVTLRLPELWHPLFEIDGFERASVDRFWLGIDARDPLFDRERTARALAELEPLRVVPVPEQGG